MSPSDPLPGNAEIDVIWAKFQHMLEPLREQINTALGKTWGEWEIPRDAEGTWPNQTKELLSKSSVLREEHSIRTGTLSVPRSKTYSI